jgi:hypothetical protein
MRITLWLNRLLLLAATVLFTLIGVSCLINPVGKSNVFQITLGSAAAITNMRVGFGAFPLSFALIVFACLLSSDRILIGLSFLATVVGVTTGVRLLGAAVDGAAPETLMVLKPEVLLTLLSLIAIVGERRRRGVLTVVR